MGDRGNIRVLQENGSSIFLYTHWRGDWIARIVQRAIRRNERQDEIAYFTRILFSELLCGNAESDTEANERILETLRDSKGFGISADICDNEYPIVTVDCTNQRVTFEREQDVREALKDVILTAVKREAGAGIPAHIGWSFVEYAALLGSALEEAWETARVLNRSDQ